MIEGTFARAQTAEHMDELHQLVSKRFLQLDDRLDMLFTSVDSVQPTSFRVNCAHLQLMLHNRWMGGYSVRSEEWMKIGSTVTSVSCGTKSA